MHFLRPYFLFLFIPFAFLIWNLMRGLSQTSIWKNICSKELMPFVLLKNNKSNWLFYSLCFFVLSLLVLAASGPAWDKIEEPVFKKRSGLVIVLDLSESMNAEDIKPSRLKRVIYKINDLLKQKKDGQTALIVFSEKPFVVTPLTDDVENILAQLPVLETKIMPSSGHLVDKAIEKAIQLLKQTGTVDGSILLVTAELSGDELKKSSKVLKDEKVMLSILGAGKEEKTPIPKEGGGFLKDKNGSLLMTSLNVENLKTLSDAGHGVYASLSVDDSDIDLLLTKGMKESDLEIGKEGFKVDKWRDLGQFFVMLSLPFFSLIFRKGIFLFLCLLIPQIGYSSIWTEKKAEELFHSQNYTAAKELFENSDWKAAAHYKLQEYDLASELFKQNKSVDGLYNYGTARAKVHDFENALKAYAEVLAMDPNHEDALYNKTIIEEFQKQQSNSESGKDDKNKQKNDSESDENQGDSQNKGNEESDSESGKDEDDKEKNDSQANENQDDSQNNEESEQNDHKKQSVDAEDNKDEGKDNRYEESRDSKEEDEQKEIDARWLKRVPDDPGGLLRRKFLQQYRL